MSRFLEEIADLSDDANDSGVGQSSQVRKKLRTNEEHQSDGKEQIAENHNSINFVSIDPEVLDCFICYERLSVPVFQCENGHAACSMCCLKLGKKCASCAMPIGTIRCRAIENVLESLKVSCINAKYGCAEIVSYSKINEHQNSCLYVPCFCPLPGCGFVASSKELSLHFTSEHAESVISIKCGRLCKQKVSLSVNDNMLILQEKKDGVLFILNNFVLDNVGNAVNINCIGPASSKTHFGYEVSARSCERSSGVHFHSIAKYSPRINVSNLPSSEFLVIPSCLFSASGELKLEICIRPGTTFAANRPMFLAEAVSPEAFERMRSAYRRSRSRQSGSG